MLPVKQCSICKQEKPFSEFNKHVNMKDGYVKFCKECQRAVSKANYSKRKTEVDKTTKGYIKRHNFWTKYPEKLFARKATKKIKKEDGYHLHHWSYNEEHWTDVIKLTPSMHAKLHRRMIYDQERMMYRNLSGVLLDSKEVHIEYINSLNSLP